jgi:predicted transcriptional regulator
MEIKVEENNDLVKDTRSGAVLNTNTSAYTASKRRRLYNQQRENDINSIKEELAELKGMLRSLLENG